jgi:hypothetical protein
LFGAETGFGPGVDLVFAVEIDEVVAESFALLFEAGAGETEEAVGVGCDGRARFEEDDGGIDFGRGVEGARFHFEEEAGVGEDGGLDGEVAVIAAAVGGDQTLGNLFLHEENSAREVETDHVFQDWGGDVIREIADDRGASPLGEVAAEDVGMDDLEALGETGAEVVDEIGVEFDGNDTLSAFEKFFGEGAAAGANLNDQRSPFGTYGRGDPFENTTLDEKVLAESLTQVSCARESARSARCESGML